MLNGLIKYSCQGKIDVSEVKQAMFFAVVPVVKQFASVLVVKFFTMDKFMVETANRDIFIRRR